MSPRPEEQQPDGLDARLQAEVRRVHDERAEAVERGWVDQLGASGSQGGGQAESTEPLTDVAGGDHPVALELDELIAASDGFVARALAAGRSVVPSGLALMRADASLAELRLETEDGAGISVARGLKRLASRWSRAALEQDHPKRALFLLLEAALCDASRRATDGAPDTYADLLWEQVLAAAHSTRELLVARLACRRLTAVAAVEARYDFAAYLAARLAEVAEACGELAEASQARLQESEFWELADELTAAFEAAQVGLEDACSANDRPRVTQALLATGRLAGRGGGEAIAEEAFRGALGALSQGADSSAIFAHARFGLANVAARRARWTEVIEHLERARQHALDAGQLPLYARAVIAATDVRLKLDQPIADYLTIARRDATASWGLGAAGLFKGLSRRVTDSGATTN